MKCTQCGSTQIFQHLRVLDQVGEKDKSDLALETHLSPQALFLTDAVSIPVAANVCIDCGNVMFSIRDAADLAKIQQAAQAMVDAGEGGGEQDLGFGNFMGEEGKSSK